MNPEDLIPTQAPVAPAHKWSHFQQAIFTAISSTTDNLSIEAVAGSGKSTTIIAGAKQLPLSSDNLFLAFNKSIVVELAGRLPYSTQCKTLNALGHGLLMRKLKNAGHSPQMNAYRLWDCTKSVLNSQQWEDYGPSVVKMVSMARHAGIGIVSPIRPTPFEQMLGEYEIEIDERWADQACKQAAVVLDKMIDTVEKEWDFDDQLYMPVFYGMSFPKFDTVFIDEAQDLSKIQHLMLLALAERGARIIAVGDSRQAIYGFRGADGDSMANLAEKFSMSMYPLSISYRCPKAVVREAQKIVYHIQSSDTAIEGSVTELQEYPDIADYPLTSMIISRTNAPIMSLALNFLKEKRPCRVKSSFGKDTITFIRSFKAKTTDELQTGLSKWLSVEKPLAESKGWYGKANMYQEKYDALMPFCQAFPLVVQIIAAMQQLFSNNDGPIISTIHKAKGLESPTVYILRPDQLPAPFVKTERGLIQENNLKYVAVTRAQDSLIYLPGY